LLEAVEQRLIRNVNGQWLANNEPLRFVHFSGVSISDPTVFSSHSTQFTSESLREMSVLLTDYRDRVKRRGHAEFSAFEYAFGWSGASGDNVHTPQPKRS
jgi:hypothetical protein